MSMASRSIDVYKRQAALYRGPDFKDLKRVEPADWIDTSYIDGVLKSAGVDRSMDAPAR